MITSITTPGLVKTHNEDVINIRRKSKKTTICICDGHWGDTAAIFAGNALVTKFPKNRSEAVSILSRVQFRLFRLQTTPDPPETSVLAVELDPENSILNYLSYGDCRLLVVRKGRIIFKTNTAPTWLGALSYQGLRNRLPVKQTALFGTIDLKKGDRIFLFTDGVDECVYNVPTISHSWLIRHTLDEILDRIIYFGAQDNASLVIIKC